MQFSTLEFAFFFFTVFAVYWSLPWKRARICWLVAASLYFYASWSPELAFLVLATSVMDYLLGRGIGHFRDERIRKGLMLTSLTVNLGVLCYFKYANFFLDSLRAGLAARGINGSIPALEIIVPFGISFYTFEAISYTIDVYRRRIEAETRLSHFLLFILFFPHLVAGPIVRAWDFLPQVQRLKRWSWLRLSYGMQLFVVGLFKKLAISDNMAFFSDPIFADPGSFKGPALWLGMIAFAIRIWADFSGYSDMALGAAHALGFKLTRNFNLPYLALNVSEFWRRWHISLSTWLRDYLFIPLGGNRGSSWATSRNLLITMSLGGLWHGANWSYLLWGVAHGMFLIIHRSFRAWAEPRPRVQQFLQAPSGKFLRWLATMICIVASWALFQPSLEVAVVILKGLLMMPSGYPVPGNEVFLIVSIVALVALQYSVSSRSLAGALKRVPVPMSGAGYAALFFAALLLSPQQSKVFIYFQF